MPSSSISFLASPESQEFVIRMANLPAVGLHSSQLRPIEPGVNHPLAQTDCEIAQHLDVPLRFAPRTQGVAVNRVMVSNGQTLDPQRVNRRSAMYP